MDSSLLLWKILNRVTVSQSLYYDVTLRGFRATIVVVEKQ